MIILKTKAYGKPEDITKFINVNQIKREDILTIVPAGNSVGQFTLFFYGDSATEEISKGVFGWDN